MSDGRKDNKFGHGGMSEKEKQQARAKGGQKSSGNFKNDPNRASKAGEKGGQNSH
ncbi:MAG: general stress protein [Pseudomonadota bacterium]